MDKLKKNIKNWVKQNKILLITFAIATVILIFTTYFISISIVQNISELQIQTETITDTELISEQLGKFGTIGIIGLLTFGIWIILMLMVAWKVIFPSKESAKQAFCINELEFLMKLPSQIRREMDKYE